ncbi:piggyBac transposable element-derived protein 3-like [Neodiprion lecontei]|uniref:PiggyBac transposable element-derived protein 3-like n=1 Tax=Neodiprion lecontei TaxID=441921 RepID=A0ABM3FQC4_NEOLC|nr:piggyBac transposable element-derived protein 3-like [Neodiprion lecontei]
MLDIFRKNAMQFGMFTSALSIDEMMIKYFGRLSIKQFIKTKPIRFGVKMWGICSPEGFLYDLDVYCGKTADRGVLSNVAQGSQVVLQMLKGLLLSTSPRNLVRDSKNVSILSTAVGVYPLQPVKRYSKIEKKKAEVQFPNAFRAYNRFMGGVDLHDQHCNKLLPSIRSKKWTWVILMRVIQASITNATVLYNLAKGDGKKLVVLA